MRRVLLGLMLVSLLAAGVIAHERHQLERQHRTVQLVMDFGSVRQMAAQEGLPVEAVLDRLAQQGVTSIGLHPRTLAETALSGRAIPAAVSDYWDQNQHPALLMEPVGFWPDDAALIRAAGLGVVPRIAAAPWGSTLLWSSLPTIENDSPLVLFSSRVVPGYPADLDQTADRLRQAGALVGRVEFTQARGLSAVTQPETSVRVHSIGEDELKRLPLERISVRYLRAVQERGVRVLYLRFPLLETVPGGIPQVARDDGWAMLAALVQGLEQAGYDLGPAEPLSAWQAPSGTRAAVVVGVLAFLLWFVRQWLYPAAWMVLLAVAAVIGGLWQFPDWTYQGLALLAAAAAPAAGIMLAVRLRCSALLRFGCSTAVSLAGALWVVALLSDSRYLTGWELFRGVKLMHALPVLLVLAFVLLADHLPYEQRQGQAIWQRMKRLMHTTIPGRYLLLALPLGLAAFVYLMRTGNTALPVPQLELVLRESLEQLLPVRPRTKEFLLGHPVLLLTLLSGRYRLAGLALGVIGQLSLINSFAHLHTPLAVSLWRSLLGLALGIGLGGTSWLMLCLLGRWRRDSRLRLPWLRQLGG